MRNASKFNAQFIFKAFILLALLIPVQAGYSAMPMVKAAVVCPEPHPEITAKTGSSVSFAWDAVTGASYYRVWYYREEDDFTSSDYTTGSTSISFTSLPSGTYHFHFETVCPGQISDDIIIDVLI